MLKAGKFFSKCIISLFSLFALFSLGSCNFLFGSDDEDKGGLTVERVLPESDASSESGTYYKISDIKTWRAAVSNSRTGTLYFIPSTSQGSSKGKISSAQIDTDSLSIGDLKAGKYFYKAYAFDAAGTQIASTKLTEEGENPSVSFEEGESKKVSANLSWGAYPSEDGQNAVSVRFYDVEKQSLIGNILNLNSGDKIPDSKIPLKTGFRLKCYKDSACTVKFDLASTAVTYSITIWSKWISEDEPDLEPDERLVKFETRGAGTIAYQIVKVGETAQKPEDPSKTGYNLLGWFTSDDGGTTLSPSEFDFTTPINENLTLYAKWETIRYQITYQLDGGNNGTNPDSYTVEDEVTFDEATKLGWQFDGWFTSTDGGTTLAEKITKISKGSTGDLNLWAKWGEITDFYVSSSGDDTTNVGTKKSPFKTISRAVLMMKSKADLSKDYKIFVSGKICETADLSDIPANSLLISGLTGSASDILSGDLNGDGTGDGTVLTISTSVPVTIKNIKITDGNGMGGGGLFVGSGTNVTISDGTLISGNNSTAMGGGIYISSGTLTMEDGSISGNTSVSQGSGIYNGGTFILKGSAVISSDNDVYLPSGKTIQVGDFTSSGSASTVATITPPNYIEGTQILEQADGAATNLSSKTSKFAITPEVSGSETILWTLANDGKLKKRLAETTVTFTFEGDIEITKTESGDTVTLTASTGFAGYTWTATPTITGASSSGRTYTFSKSSLTESGIAYSIQVTATKNGITYSTEVTIAK